MKKVVLMVLVVGLFVGAAAEQALAQGKKAEFSLNLGVQTNVWSGTSFDNAWFTLDARVGIALGKSFEISPEVMGVVDDSFNFSDVGWFIYPGVMLNYKAGNFFVGVGVVLPIAFFEGESDSGNPAPKVNVGYKFGSFVFTLYAFTWTESGLDFLDMNFVGATAGYRF
jgi:hypothetical protein